MPKLHRAEHIGMTSVLITYFHGVWTPDEAFFLTISQTFGPIGQIVYINFGVLGLFSAQYSVFISVHDFHDLFWYFLSE